MLQKIKAWFQSKGGYAHVIAAIWGGSVLAYAAVPAFHSLIITVWGVTPSALRDVLAAGIGLYTWYSNNQKKGVQ